MFSRRSLKKKSNSYHECSPGWHPVGGRGSCSLPSLHHDHAPHLLLHHTLQHLHHLGEVSPPPRSSPSLRATPLLSSSTTQPLESLKAQSHVKILFAPHFQLLFLNQETEASTLLPGFQTKLLVLDHLELNGYFFCVGPLFGYW